MSIVSRFLSRSNLEWASIFIGFAIIWMVSGLFVEEPTPPALIEKKEAIVRVIDQKAENFSKQIVVKGFTKADKKVLVKSETSGKIIELPIPQGTLVKKGEVICSLFVAERQANFDKSLLDFNSAKKLYEEELYSSKQLQNAKSNYERAKLELDYANIKAPFDGVVDRIDLDVGDFLNRGSTCATVLDLDPMMITGDISESELLTFTKDSDVRVITNDGQEFQGKITFISSSADEMMHTFDIEISIPNPLGNIKDGQTAKVIVSATPEPAHIVPLSILRLDEKGNIGIRLVNKDNLVEFYTVEIIQDTENGVWVSGLPFNSRIITVGQDYVNNNEKVDIAIDYRLKKDENVN
jgi:multidrug efflux system membrane fusion protein